MQKLLFFIILVVFITPFSVCAQKEKKKPLLDPHVRKMGPYFGIQQGEYTVGEIGMEFQFKNISFRKPKTNAFHAGLGYNIPNNALQINGGYYHKPSRVDLTYGVDVCMRSDFLEERFGFAPVIGYKLFGFHIRAGYMFLTPPINFVNTNTLFINLRFTLVNNRKFEWNRRK